MDLQLLNLCNIKTEPDWDFGADSSLIGTMLLSTELLTEAMHVRSVMYYLSLSLSLTSFLQMLVNPATSTRKHIMSHGLIFQATNKLQLYLIFIRGNKTGVTYQSQKLI